MLFAEQENEGRYRFRYGYVAETGGRLKTDWYGHNTAPRNGTSSNVNVVWPTSSNYSIPRVSTTDPSTDDGYAFWDASDESTEAGGHAAESDFYNFRNALTFDIDDGKDYTTVTDKKEYKGIANYKKISKFDWTLKAYWYNKVTSIIGGPKEHLAEGSTETTTRNPVYILNYKKLLDKITMTLDEKKDTFLVDNESFRSGNSVGFFGTFDNVLSLDVTDTTKYNYELNPETAVQKAGIDINDACIDLDEITSTAAAMSTLVNNINRYETMMADNPYRYNLAETYTLYLKAKECFDAYIFGQKNDPDEDGAFLTYLASVSNEFDTALSAFSTFASYTVDGQGNKTFIADPITGNYIPDRDTKIFEGDTNGGVTAVSDYKAAGAFNNVVYFPTVTQSNGVRAKTNTYSSDGGGNVSGVIYNGGYGDGVNHFRVYYPREIVLAYNGTSNPVFPVLCSMMNYQGGAGREGFHTAIYPTESPTLVGQSDTYIKGSGWQTQTVDGTKYSECWYPNLTSSSGYSYYNENMTYAPAVSSSFRIKEQAAATQSDWTSTTYWKGVYGKSDIPLNWFTAWNMDTSGLKGDGLIYGAPDKPWSHYFRLETLNDNRSKKGSIAASAVEFYANPFEGKTAEDTGYYNADYSDLYWYHAFHNRDLTNFYLRAEIVSENDTNIRVLNVVPAIEAKNDLLESTSTQDILGAIFQYDKDSADVIKFLKALDKVGSFNPNAAKYDYSATTEGTHQYSTNAGVEQACKDMAELVNSTTEALNYIDDSTDSEHSTVNDNKINTPTDATSKSTDTSDPGEGWYADLRRALLNPLEPDSCTDDAAYAAYKAVLDKAQDAVAYSATSKIGGGAGVDYEAEYNGQTIPAIAEELVEATETSKNAPAKHIFSYEDENENQISTWDCASNAAHNHETADMSAYNELEIAYQTIDPEAYDNFENLVAAKYDGSAYDDSSEEAKDYSDLSFKEVKTKKTKKGGTPQDFVDQGVMNLLEAINTAATENDGEHLSSYKVKFNVNIDGENHTLIDPDYPFVLDGKTYDGIYKYGSKETFDVRMYDHLNGASVYKWSIKIGDGEERFIDSKSSALECSVQRDCTITAYANSALTSNQAKVTIIGPTGSTLDVVHAAKSASVAFSFDSESNKATVSIGGVNYEIASTPSYTVTGVKVNGSTEDYAGQSGLTVQGLLDTFSAKELRIAPIKTVAHKEATFTITANGTGGTVNNNNDTGTANTLSGIVYDTKIRINYTPDTSKGTYYGMVINEAEMSGGTVANYIPITYGDEYYFRAISDMNIYPLYQKTLDGGAKAYYVDDGSADGVRITDKDSVYRLQHKLPFVISFMDTDNVTGKFFFRCLYTHGLPENVKVTEAGWVYFRCVNNDIKAAVGALLPSEADLTVNNTKTVTEGDYTATIGRTASTKLNTAEVRETHQYSFSSKDSAHTYILGRGYVKYEYTFSESIEHDGETTTVNAPIEAISYGRADFYLNSNS